MDKSVKRECKDMRKNAKKLGGTYRQEQSKHLKVACTENFTQEVEGEELSKPVKFRKKCKSYSEQEAERFAEHVSKAARKV